MTLESNAYTIHQVVAALRGSIAGRGFGTVVLVGHSYRCEPFAWTKTADDDEILGKIKRKGNSDTRH